MLKNLLSNRIFIGILVLLICGVVSVYFLRTDIPEEPIKIYTPVEPMPKPKTEAPIGETERGGHVHEDGTWHEGAHEAHQNPAAPSSAQIPDGITDPEVLAAWQRLDYIAKNPFEWGGHQSDRALELMDELTPMWVIDDPHDHGEELMMTLDLLAEERDPRSAALLLMYQLDSPVSGRPIREALAAMGPAAVPAVIARLNPEDAADVFMAPIIRDVVVPIVAQHRSELGSIVDYIILPRLEAIAALEDPPGDTFVVSNRSRARDALARIKK
ncbi:hypothetical protein F4054_02035 [Candidatus Poribacteria bacterium]|nr:hypothetical protein [Candidatus Poribacteria bacterium]